MIEPTLSNEIAIVACGYPANEMAAQLSRLVARFDRGNVRDAAMQLVDSLTLVADVMETYPKEYMSQDMKDIPEQLREWLLRKRQRAAELKRDIQDFEQALAETGVSSQD
ncbi:MAG: hypothetical protein ABSC13_02310 [Dehalococcoidia bacterium]